MPSPDPQPPAKPRRATPATRRPNPVFSDDYAAIRQVLVAARMDAGLTQGDLARRIGKTPSHLCMIERGQRRVDVLELFSIADNLGVDIAVLIRRIADRLQAGPVHAATDPSATWREAAP